ncbi:MAG TPA: DUF3833 family protein [Caulobacteraceae bacterium]|nr:DUF3833 family protein [Caulobacteraceae bacterium]
MDARSPYAGELVFRPELFFLGRTEGAAVVRDVFGRVRRRCSVSTQGEARGAYEGIRFEETFTYDDGEVDVWRWALTCGVDGRYMVAEAVAGSGIVGRRTGEDYVLSFQRPMGPARGLAAPRYSTRFTLLAPDTALKVARVTVLGAPMGEMTAIHRRV